MKVLRLRKNNNYNIFSRFYHKPLNQKKNLCDLIAFQWHVMRKTWEWDIGMIPFNYGARELN